VNSNSINTVIARMRGLGEAPAFFHDGKFSSYADFMASVDEWRTELPKHGIGAGSVVGVFGDYSPGTITLFFALMLERAVLVPFTKPVEPEMPSFMEIGRVEHLFRFDGSDAWSYSRHHQGEKHELIEKFLERGTPGLVVFTSGSTGKPKGILHDCERVMRKFVAPRPGWRTLLFLLMDHFGGFNTMLGAFAYGGIGVCPRDRGPEAICEAIEKSQATLLPTTPTFLNLLIASGSWRNFDLSSLQLITYGTEVMPEATLAAVRKIFANVTVKQTYGLSEVGVLRSRSESDDNLWVKVGGDGFEIKVVEGILWIRSEANMVGYLNAPQPFDEEGWFCTGDHVEINGEYMRFMGRKSEIINVGGQKVFPSEVETVLLEAGNISEATVFAIAHPLLGQAVAARVSIDEPEEADALKARLRDHCRQHLIKFKIPMRFDIVSDETQRSERFKKIRRIES
jgi:long-chain acyl-CoA synthetase